MKDNSKGMMNDGAESKRVTIFVIKKYGVVYRLRSPGLYNL